MAGRLLYYTRSVCPVCLRGVTAALREDNDRVYMEKNCPEHGRFRTLVWEDDGDGYAAWLKLGGLDIEKLPQSEAEAEALSGDFAACASCRPASAALMTTNACNMDCPVCFTRDHGEPLRQPDLAECRRRLEGYRERAGENALLELCGGEPTVRPDICELASMARDTGFDFIQLNTNGINLASSPELCRRLKESGVTTVYLGFDGMTEKPYLAKYGRPMLDIKKRAVENSSAAGLAVVLVCCVIPGENSEELGAIVDYAKRHMPHVRGVYFQPVSWFGIYPEGAESKRITIPGVIRRLERQHEDISAKDFSPGHYEHPQCSFNACYMKDRAGHLRPLTNRETKPAPGVERLRDTLRRSWLPSKTELLTVGGMAFQDSGNIDLVRLRRCSIQIIGEGGVTVPLCAKYLTGCGGARLLPGID